MLKSIRLRLTLYFAIVIAIILLGTSYLIYENAYTNRISNLDGSLHVVTSDMINDAEENLENNDSKDIFEDMEELQEKFRMGALYVQVLSYDLSTKMQQVIARSSKAKGSTFGDFNFMENLDEDEIIYQTYNNHRVATQFVKIDKRTLLIVQTAAEISFKDESLRHTILILFGVNSVIFLFSIFGTYFLISRTLLPVHNVVSSVNEIESYDYTKRVSAKNIPNEIKELVDTFNELLSRHKESFSKISQFSSDASHELKTPLTVMRGEIEVGLRKSRSEAEYQNILENILSEIVKIQHLIDGLLFLAKTDKLEIKSTFEEVYLDEIITDCAKELEICSFKKSIKIEINHLVPLTVEGNGTLLKIACFNLLKNAIVYSPENTKIKMWIEERDDGFIIAIQDQGIGIAKEDLKHIFNRFYRVNKSRSRSSGGAGLGLSIVKMILDIHGFDISFESEVQKGTLVRISVKKV